MIYHRRADSCQHSLKDLRDPQGSSHFFKLHMIDRGNRPTGIIEVKSKTIFKSDFSIIRNNDSLFKSTSRSSEYSHESANESIESERSSILQRIFKFLLKSLLKIKEFISRTQSRKKIISTEMKEVDDLKTIGCDVDETNMSKDYDNDGGVIVGKMDNFSMENETESLKKETLVEKNAVELVNKVKSSIQEETTTTTRSDSKLNIEKNENQNLENKPNYRGYTDNIKSLPSKNWPQSPILLTPTPDSGTRIKSVRFVSTTSEEEYLMDESFDKLWWHELEKQWIRDPNKRSDKVVDSSMHGYCILPINNGNERHGKSLVVDFESNLFQGTLQVRIRNINGTTSRKYDDNAGFFNGREAQYQCVISGRFKREGIPMTECVTGQIFKKPLNTPPAYITKGAIKFVSFFAPRLQADLNSEIPSVLSPLGSTAQSIQVDVTNDVMIGSCFRATDTIMNTQEEPTCPSRMLIELQNSTSLSSSVGRAKERKKAFDKLCANGNTADVFRTDRIYTFEFLQHLFDYGTMELSLGRILGKSKLNGILNGQPLGIMAVHQDCNNGYHEENKYLWSFDIWHESILSKN